MKTEESTKRSRITIRIPTELLDWVRLFAKKKSKTVTQVLIDHLVHLKEQERRV